MATLKVSSTLDPSGFNRGVDGMKRKAKEINGAGGRIGGGSGGGSGGMGFGQVSSSVAAGNLLTDALSKVKDMAVAGWNELSKLGMVAKSLGAEVPAINEIQDAMAEWGVEGDRVLSILEKIDIARSQAVEGNNALAKSFEQAGVSMEDLINLDPTQIFGKMAKAAASGGTVAPTVSAEAAAAPGGTVAPTVSAEAAAASGGTVAPTVNAKATAEPVAQNDITGQAMTGISAIIGKRNMAGLEMPMMEFGKGFRNDHMFEPDQRAADIVAITERKARSAAVSSANAIAVTETKSAGINVSEAEIKAEQDRRVKGNKIRIKRRVDAVKQARERIAAELEEEKEDIRTEGAARLEEEKKGIGFQRMEVSQEQSVGIGSIEGSGFDMGVANEANRQVEIAEKTKEIMTEVQKLIAKVEEHAKKTADAVTAE